MPQGDPIAFGPGPRPRSYGGLREPLADGWRVLRSARRLRSIYADGRVDPLLREQILVAVSRTNACRWCTEFHETRAGSVAGDGDPRAATAVAYAVARAQSRPGRPDPAVEQAFSEAFGPRERGDLEAVIDLILCASLGLNTVRAQAGGLWRRLPAPPARRG